MPFTQVQITGIITVENEIPAAGAQVQFLLSKPINDGTVNGLFPLQFTEICAADGSFTITVPANNDPTTFPVGTYYTVKIYYQGQYLGVPFKIVVPYNSGPTVDLFTLMPPSVSTSPVTYVAKIIAGTGVTISPSTGTGNVTISTTGLPTFALSIGDGTATTYSVAHNLNTTDVMVTVIDLTSGEIVYPTVIIVDVNHVNVQFSVAPTTNEMRVIVVGA